MVKVNWDVEELVALIDIYRKSDGKTVPQINEELLGLSRALNRRADILGIQHDDKFRNLNGMKMMYQNVVYIATEGQHGMSSTSIPMKKVYGLLERCPDVFELILNEFRNRYCISTQ